MRNRELEEAAERNRQAIELERIELQCKAEADASERLRVATSSLAGLTVRFSLLDLPPMAPKYRRGLKAFPPLARKRETAGDAIND